MELIDLELRPDDESVRMGAFDSYRTTNMRRAVRYTPSAGEPDELSVKTPWGEQLTCRKGDYIVSEMDNPKDRWPVAADIFESTYLEVEPGHYIKRAVVHLAPLTAFTPDNPDALVAVYTQEGVVRVRSGDFYLARGVKGEIWPIPADKVRQSMVRVEEEDR